MFDAIHKSCRAGSARRCSKGKIVPMAKKGGQSPPYKTAVSNALRGYDAGALAGIVVGSAAGTVETGGEKTALRFARALVRSAAGQPGG